MKKAQLLWVTAVLGLAVVAHGQKERGIPTDYPYSPAFISTISAPPGHTELVVFPLSGKAFKIPVRSASSVVFSPDGKALYGACTPYPTEADEPIKIASCKIDLKTGTTTPVPGSVHVFRAPVSNSKDRMFGFSLPEGKPTTIFLRQQDNHPWMYLSLSPDSERAVATHNGRVELIDIARGTTKPLGDEFFIAAWSPDGKWLAAVEQGEKGRTILMDARDLKRKRILGTSELDWSPDSQYLLGLKSCDEYYGTLEAINIETGERTTIKSSECQVNQATTGWVISDIARE